MKLMPGSIPASAPPQVTAFTPLQKRRAPTPPPSLPPSHCLFSLLASVGRQSEAMLALHMMPPQQLQC